MRLLCPVVRISIIAMNGLGDQFSMRNAIAALLIGHSLSRLAAIQGIKVPPAVFSKANSVFGDPDLAREWMDTAIPALGGQTPISLCDTFEGRSLVQVALRKIEYGEFV